MEQIGTQSDIYVGTSYRVCLWKCRFRKGVRRCFGSKCRFKIRLFNVFDNNLALCTIGSGALQSVDTMSGAGFGYGAGLIIDLQKTLQ